MKFEWWHAIVAGGLGYLVYKAVKNKQLGKSITDGTKGTFGAKDKETVNPFGPDESAVERRNETEMLEGLRW